MEEEQKRPAWTDDCEATLVAIRSQLDDLPSYEHQMNVVVNALRGIMTREAIRGIREVTKSRDIELPTLIIGLEVLTEEFVTQFATMPKRVKDVITAEDGCGHCEACKQAKRDAYADGKAIVRPRKADSVRAVEQLIATMTGGSTKH